MNRPLAFTNESIAPVNVRQGLSVVCWLIYATAACAQQFPYQAYVTAKQAYVRSGPGQRYYPTERIPEGFAVEVYRHDSAGWCAIRPPEGSFSWVPSHQVRPVDRGVVEIVGDRVVTRVGSTLSPNRSAVQVLLPQGEHVELLAADENDDPRWVRVAAPAGEFRWIDADCLSLQPPLEPTPLPNSNQSGWSKQAERSTTVADSEPGAFHHLHPTAVAAPARLQFEEPTRIPAGKQVLSIPIDPNAIDVVAGSPAEMQLAQFQSSPAAGPLPRALLGDIDTPAQPTPLPAQALQPRVRFHGLTADPAATDGSQVRSVEELEVRLSQAVVKPPQEWELEPLETAANRLLAVTKTPPVRAQLREVLQRIARFQQVQQRYADPELATMPPITASSRVEEQDPFTAIEPVDFGSQELTGIASDIRERVEHDLAGKSGPALRPRLPSADKPLYDAAGLLKPVVSKRQEAPQYALVDEQGKVVSFVTPTPDLNLQPYVGRRIGVHGTRGFMPEYRRAHVTAGRVTPIEVTLRR